MVDGAIPSGPRPQCGHDDRRNVPPPEAGTGAAVIFLAEGFFVHNGYIKSLKQARTFLQTRATPAFLPTRVTSDTAHTRER